ncbi:hypothetical protein SAMN04487996_105120 [Dyadobacter soli]|uniref:Uncharacterized protein n=1 Tax=Dyadobacter soli TaxID=659014 RepID=A0A1G7D6H3_9BACT|nr:hypothetical protein [Dyadobacter soli]SDE46355.1 hypothetical protein SAMN04487996_105120 [Dyadobacter soli]
MSTLQEFEHAQSRLSREITSLKKQSVLALALAVVFIISTIVLLIQVKHANNQLKVSEDRLKVMNDSIQDLNKQLNTWRVSLITKEPEKPKVKPNPSRPHISAGYEIALPPVAAEAPKPFLGLIVYIHDRKGSRVSDTLKAALLEKGAIVPSIQHISNKMPFGNAVKYFHPNESQTAETLKSQLDQILGKKAIQAKVPVRYLANDKVPIGQFEVWIDR